MHSLFFKLTLTFTIVAVITVGTMALLTSRATTAEFHQYLEHTRHMQEMMGGMMGGMMSGMMLGTAEQNFIQEVNRSLWLAGLVGIGVAVILSLMVTHRLTTPLRHLTTVARRIASGDLSQRVRLRSRDEVGELAFAFDTMAESLERKERDRRQLLADIAHELRTPLTVLQGNLEAMLDGVVPPTPEELASLHQESLLLSRLVTDLRDLSLAEAGQLRLERAPADLKKLLADGMAGIETQASQQQISLRLEVSPDLPSVMIDSDRIRQVLHNLLSNSLRYTPPGGSIEVGAKRLEAAAPETSSASPPQVLVWVSDTGRGISAQDLPHIFDHFYRADKSRQRASGGSGLGLAIVKHFVEAHGGRVWAESQPGKGSTFYFTLPTAEPG
jgi:signal transduction histidine kinase